ncbi:cobalt-precorrin 5A hydrolase / precorrin-3B C17-methyltransferase [Fulvimarina manganoxydans]|uniref:Cobalt-precorrin 5A hydrolase / precorrin-3B C17-methyltransferase n=1 Tax=Fulvimarina manganoxydans TaxID=937218 RepID=A0A1W2AKT4_9HYPH|nr:precorrin-3B C(17)-methyltransferase [Fulvimarina manganoxydans]SMC61051.1 cobalt-precorrin 5A hydrolase / precorrin-3B C17-methyltransferase [Fulvimarina manganoxydans]
MAILILSDRSYSLAKTIAGEIDGEIHGASARCRAADVLFASVADHLRALFNQGRPIVAVMAAGAAIRILAPVLSDKRSEPPVVVMSENGASVVPILGGHHGGNDLARRIGDITKGHVAITTAGDTAFGIALDEPPQGYRLENTEEAKSVMAALLSGEPVAVEGDAAFLKAGRFEHDEGASHRLTISAEAREPRSGELLYRPQTFFLGLGAERGAPPEEALALAEAVLSEARVSPLSLAAVASLDMKADEAAIHAVAERYGVPARFFAADALEAEASRLENPSEIVFAEVGCHGVAEGAALASVGAEGRLRVAKRKSHRVTAALAEAPRPIVPRSVGRSRGRLFVVGIGPGQGDWRSPEASRMIAEASDLVGYSLYLDLLGPLAKGKTRHDFDLGREEARVRHAMELAGEGRDVALVCSGDAGIYAMATLVFELLDRGDLSDGARRIAIEVAPGISALQAAAARTGAPLGHDFCTISLSDLLTPWEDIQRRVNAAAEGDFVIAFYNPVSRRRRTQLAYARDELLKWRPAETPVILATNLGRESEHIRIVPLAELQVDDVDMLTVVIVGSSNSRVVRTGDGREWAYTPRGYARKSGSGISASEPRDEKALETE